MLLTIFASTVTCVLGLDCDLSASLRTDIEKIPNVKKAEVIQDYSINESYHARITLQSGDVFDLAYISTRHLSAAKYFRIRNINGYQYDYVYCEKPTSANQIGRIRHDFFSLGSDGSFQRKFPFVIRNIKDIVQNFEFIKIEYLRPPVVPKFLHENLPNGEEIYATLFKVADKHPLGPSAYLSGEPHKNAWKFKGYVCKAE